MFVVSWICTFVRYFYFCRSQWQRGLRPIKRRDSGLLLRSSHSRIFCVCVFLCGVVDLWRADLPFKEFYQLSIRFIISELINSEWKHTRKPILSRQKNKENNATTTERYFTYHWDLYIRVLKRELHTLNMVFQSLGLLQVSCFLETVIQFLIPILWFAFKKVFIQFWSMVSLFAPSPLTGWTFPCVGVLR